MQAVRGSRVRMSAHSAVFRGGTAPPASPGARGSTAHTRSSGHGSTVTFRRILCSKRCLCSASTTELSHSRRKVGCSPERSGSLRGDEGVEGSPSEGLAVGSRPWWLCRPSAPVPLDHLGMKAPPTPREGAAGISPAVAGQALARQVQSRALGPQWRPVVKVR